MKVKISFLFAIWFSLVSCLSEPVPAEDPQRIELLRVRMEEIDKILSEEGRTVRVIDWKGKSKDVAANPLDRRGLVKVLSEMLNMPSDMLTKAFVTEKYKMSDILFTRHISDSKLIPFESVLAKKPVTEWIAQLQKEKITFADVIDSAEVVYAELAFHALDFPPEESKKSRDAAP